MDRLIYKLYEDDLVHLQLEVHNEQPFLHCDVKPSKWTKDNYKEMLAIWIGIMEELKGNGIDYLFTWSPTQKSARYSKMFGFKEVVSHETGQSLMFLKF